MQTVEPLRSLPLVMSVVLLVAGCGGGAIVSLTGGDTGREVSLVSGDRMELSLESNRTTGYEWVLTAFEELDGTLVLREERFLEPESGLVGAAGTQEFVFEAVGPGAGILRLEYVRPFEDPPVAERAVEFLVRVDGAVWPPPDTGETPAITTSGGQ